MFGFDSDIVLYTWNLMDWLLAMISVVIMVLAMISVVIMTRGLSGNRPYHF